MGDPIEREREYLKIFLEEVMAILSLVVTTIEEFDPEREKKFYNLVREVWRLDILRAFSELAEKIYSEELDARDLKSVGLHGRQLELKIMQFNHRANEFKAQIEKEANINLDKYKYCRKENEFMIKEGKGKKKGKGIWSIFNIRDRFKKLVNIINIILDSLVPVALPAEIIKEFKDILSNSASDQNEDTPLGSRRKGGKEKIMKIDVYGLRPEDLNKVPKAVKGFETKARIKFF